jgi:hypothetical protein
MPLSEIPKYLGPETRKLVEAALEDAWDELSKDGHFEPTPARKKLTSTMVALASVGETDHRKLKWHPCMPRRDAGGAISSGSESTN